MVSLLQPPYFDLQLPLPLIPLPHSPDIMALPFVSPVVRSVVGLALRQLAVFPRQLLVELAPHGGAPTRPRGC